MVSFTSLFVALTAAAGAIATPVAFDDPADFILTNHTTLVRRQDYTQNYQTGGNIQFSATTNGYSLTYSNAQDFVLGRGWKTGAARAITFSGSNTKSSGTSTFQVYGWTTNPLVEYYIIEDYTTQSQWGAVKGTFTTDGSTYNVYETTRTNAPSIQGTSTFHQYISVRQSKRASGTVTTGNHFSQWAKMGMNLGAYSYQVLATEAYGGASGSTKETVS